MNASTTNKNAKKKNYRRLILLVSVVAIVSIIAAVMIGVMIRNDEPIEMVNLAETYKGEILDVEGNLLVPFDVAYPEAFASGGYNVYRSTKEDGLYVRLNDFIIPADVTTFFDATVEPGVRYYYNFTVVKTDFSESTPSGKINLMSMDTMAPGIYHSPVRNAFTSSNLIIGATVTDNLMLREVKLFYRTKGTDEWSSTNMTNHNDRWSAVIAADLLSTDGLEYYIRAYDGLNYTYSGSEITPYSVTVQLAIDSSAKGDVNGDGVITNIDALMLLQVANDKLNLTAEQFLRADLDDNGELSAAEALRILKYANGSITTLMG